jgi:polar amino acid transport system substrate-binding protein
MRETRHHCIVSRSLGVAALLTILCATSAYAESSSFLTDAVNGFQRNVLDEDRYLLILSGIKTTAHIAICSVLWGSLFGGLICRMRMARSAWLTVPAKTFIAITRGTPLLVILMIAYYVVFASVNIGPVWVAIIAFGANFAAYTAEIYRSGIEGVASGQTEAGLALGFTKTQTFFYVIAPQALRRILPVYKGEVINLVKMTSIVGYIAVQDLTRAADIIRSRTFDAFFPLVMVAVLYFSISWVLLMALTRLEQYLAPGRRRVRS